VLFALVAACAAKKEAASSSRTPSWHQGAPVVHIHPMDELDRQGSVGILPFLMPAGVAAEEGRSVAGLFRDVFLGMRSFSAVRQLDDSYGSTEDAIAIGHRAGVDYVLAGQVVSALESTELGGARLEVAVRLLNVKNGGTLWYISEGIDQPVDHPDLGFVSRLRASVSPPPVRRSTGAPALPNMVVKVASDMALVMQVARAVSR
jgi:TolB-like protein